MRPHGVQPTRLLRPLDFPGKSTGVGCHCLLQNNIIGLIYLLYFFYYTFRQIHNNYVMSKLKHVCPSVQFSRVRLFATPWTAARQASLSINNSRSLLKLISIGSVMPYNHLILCHPLLLQPSIFPSIRVFSNESVPRIR